MTDDLIYQQPSRAVRIYRPTPRTIKRYTAGMASALALEIFFAPLVMVPLLVGAAGICAWKHIPGWPRLATGVIYFIFTWLLVIDIAFDEKAVGENHAHLNAPPSIAAGLLVALSCLLLLFFLWKPAKYCARLLLAQGRGFAAGTVVVSALTSCGISIALSVYLLLISL